MRFLKHILAALSLGFVAAGAFATSANPQNGTDYKTLPQAQATDSGKKIEVIEFFGYFCPHCYALDPALGEWVKKQGERVDFKRVHVVFHPSMQAMQQAYIALELMGKVETVHKKLFDAIHISRKLSQTPSEAQIIDFLVANGIDKAKFLEVYNSFSVQTRVRRAQKLLEVYGIDNVPQIAIDGRFITAPDYMRASVGNSAPESALHSALVQTLDVMIERIAKEKGAAPAAKK